jgi:two-component system, chemotaxis family, protein-glutamate methylesterase/glutaminase
MKRNLVIIGSSAGGPRVLNSLFEGMPRIDTAVLIVQHMPKFINHSLAKDIAHRTAMTVGLAEDEDILEHGQVLFAPSEVHCGLIDNRRISLFAGEKVNYVCPAVDVTMRSLARDTETDIVGVILTGMGKDGAKGIAHIKSIGGTTIAQDEKSSPIYGMPREAFLTGQVDFVLDPDQIREFLIKRFGIIDPSAVKHDESQNNQPPR